MRLQEDIFKSHGQSTLSLEIRCIPHYRNAKIEGGFHNIVFTCLHQISSIFFSFKKVNKYLGAWIICDRADNSTVSLFVIKLAMVCSLLVISLAMCVWIIHYKAGNIIRSKSDVNLREFLFLSHTDTQMQSTVQEQLLIHDEEHI